MENSVDHNSIQNSIRIAPQNNSILKMQKDMSPAFRINSRERTRNRDKGTFDHLDSSLKSSGKRRYTQNSQAIAG